MQLIRLRFYQLRRSPGIWILLLAALVSGFIYLVANDSPKNLAFISAAFVFLLLSYHTGRKDKAFVEGFLPNPSMQFLAEYNIILLIASVPMIITGNYMEGVALHLMSLPIPFIRNSKQSSPRISWLSKKFHVSRFEWISGVRQQFLLIVPLLLLALLLSAAPYFCQLSLLALNGIFIGFYRQHEPFIMLNPSHLAVEDFLSSKTGFLNKMILLVTLPLLVVNSIFNPQLVWFNAAYIPAFLLLADCSIYIKYGDYGNSTGGELHLDVFLLYLCVLIPLLIPVSMLVTYRHRKRAIANLRTITC
jgi:hypothetical protein